MPNFDALPLFPLHVVLYPEMPLPLHIFEPRYREMVMRCREEDTAFGVVLIRDGEEAGAPAVPHAIGTTARIDQFEELPDGKMNVVVTGETRFHVLETFYQQPYLTARVTPFGYEQEVDAASLQPAFDAVSGLFRDYLKTLFALTGRPLSALQLPSDPEHLSFAVATFLQISLHEKQLLLEMTATELRLQREAEILRQEIEAQMLLRKAVRAEGRSVVRPVDTDALGKLASRN